MNKLLTVAAFHISNIWTQTTTVLSTITDAVDHSTEPPFLLSADMAPTPSCCDSKYTYDPNTGEVLGVYILASESGADWDCSENCVYVK